MAAGSLICESPLRSTIAPGTTDFVAGYLRKHRGFEPGEDIFVAHAPERIAAGRFLEEIDTLPCIIGGVGARSGEVAAELFEAFGAPVVQTTPVQEPCWARSVPRQRAHSGAHPSLHTPTAESDGSVIAGTQESNKREQN